MKASTKITLLLLFIGTVIQAQNTNLTTVKFDRVVNNFLDEGITVIVLDGKYGFIDPRWRGLADRAENKTILYFY